MGPMSDGERGYSEEAGQNIGEYRAECILSEERVERSEISVFNTLHYHPHATLPAPLGKYSDENVCRSFLCGLCPNDLFSNTVRYACASTL